MPTRRTLVASGAAILNDVCRPSPCDHAAACTTSECTPPSERAPTHTHQQTLANPHTARHGPEWPRMLPMPIGFGPAALRRHARGVLGACSCLSSRAAGASWEQLSTPRRSTMPLSVLPGLRASTGSCRPCPFRMESYTYTPRRPGRSVMRRFLYSLLSSPVHAPLAYFSIPHRCMATALSYRKVHSTDPTCCCGAAGKTLRLGSTVDVRCQVAAAEERACPREHPCRIVRSTPPQSAPTGPLRSRHPSAQSARVQVGGAPATAQMLKFAAPCADAYTEATGSLQGSAPLVSVPVALCSACGAPKLTRSGAQCHYHHARTQPHSHTVAFTRMCTHR